MGSAYLLGRNPREFQPPYQGESAVFAAARADGLLKKVGSFRHCTFANISFKEATLKQMRFEDCVFVGCYFRRAQLTASIFQGCRFLDCDFPRVSVRGCDFRYCRFSNCFISYSEMELSLPQEPNLRHDLARGLALEAGKQGSPSEARAFRMCQIRAREEDLRAAMLGASQWYREHYDALRRVGAGLELAASILNRHLWGYGLRIRVLIRNFLVLTLAIFPGWFYLLRSQLTDRQGSQVSFTDCVYFSLQNMLPAAPSDVLPVSGLARGSAALESLLGVVVAGLFVSYLFSWILDQ